MGGSGHESGHGGHGFHGSPVLNGMTLVDGMHAIGEMAVSGGAPAGAFKDLAHFMGHHATDAWNGVGTTSQTLMQGATAIASPIAIAGGTMEIIDGVNQIRHGDVAGGVVTGGAGALTAGSGVAGLAGLAGSAAGAGLAAPLSAAALGVKGGAYANADVKERGWLQDREGNDASISEWAAENGQAADEWVSEHTWGPLGTIAGLGTTWASSVAGAGIALASLGLSAGEAVLGGPSPLDILNEQQGGDPMAAFHAGVASARGNPVDAFHAGITQTAPRRSLRRERP